MGTGYFSTFSKVLGQTAGYTEERDYLEDLLNRAKIKPSGVNSSNFLPEQDVRAAGTAKPTREG